MENDALYTELILMHNRSGHNKHELDHETHSERGHNPNCGDDLTLHLRLSNGVIEDASFTGAGCALSQASISIMIDLIRGKTEEEAKKMAEDFLKMARGETVQEADEQQLQDAVVFKGISKMPARTKCGTLGWNCLKTSL